MKKILCLDFDGVICDSILECMLVSYNAYNVFTDSSFTAMNEIKYVPKKIRDRFKRFRYLVRTAKEYWLLMHLLIENKKIPDQTNFNQIANIQVKALMDFEPFFFNERKRLKKEAKDIWYGLHKIYPEFSNYWKKLVGCYNIYIVTNKDQNSVSELLKYFNIPLNMDKIWGKEKNIGKINILKKIELIENASKDQILFIDDHPIYVQTIADMGIKSYLAGWGYNKGKNINSISDFKVLIKN